MKRVAGEGLPVSPQEWLQERGGQCWGLKNEEEKQVSKQKVQKMEKPKERAWAFWRMRSASTAGAQGARLGLCF